MVCAPISKSGATNGLGVNQTLASSSSEGAGAYGDSQFYNVLYACVLSGVGVLGVVLNVLVVVGVHGNARLGTTVNKLLIWISCFSLLEASIGILMKALVLGKTRLMRHSRMSGN